MKSSKINKGKLFSVIVALLVCLVAVAIIITNCFIPVKYFASFVVIRNQKAEEGVMRVRFVDVGFGDCTIIELPDGKTMLIDAGDGRNSNTAKIFKYLNKSNINTIDYLVCTSIKTEHCGGLSEIIKYKKVKKVYMPYCDNIYLTDSYSSFVKAVNSSGAETEIAEYGAGETGVGYKFSFLSPSVHTNPEGEYAKLNNSAPSMTDINNASAVLWLEYADTSFLFAGDAEDEALSLICNSYETEENYPVALNNCTVLKVPCHGSGKSTCTALYDLIQPENTVISVGENGYGYPSLSAISNAMNYNANLFRTDLNGTVTVEATLTGYTLIKEKI